MKFHILFLVLTLLISLNLSIKVEKNKVELSRKIDGDKNLPMNKADAAATASFNSELQEYWKVLFTDLDRKGCLMAKMNSKIEDGLAVVSSQPIPRKNYWGEMDMGFGRSGLLFDYLDPLLREPIVAQMKKITAIIAKHDKVKKGELDPYSLNSMLAIPYLNSPDEAAMILLVKKAKPDFDEVVWKASYNTIQLNKMIKDNHWDFIIGDTNPGKSLVNRYDFNGDGRLSNEEFIIACINSNKNIYGKQKCDNCFEDIVFDLIQPIYLWSNLDNDESLSADEMWKSWAYLDRKKSKDYDIYRCITNGDPMNTTAVNDFVLKARRTFNGSVTKPEFIEGMLIGFWYRQCTENEITSDGKRAMVEKRWKDPTAVNDACAPSVKTP